MQPAIPYAVAAGLLGASAGVAGKFAGLSQGWLRLAGYSALVLVSGGGEHPADQGATVAGGRTGTSAAPNAPCRLQCNLAMVALFSAALRRTSSLQATVAAVAANICASGLLGRLVFAERLEPRWLVGVCCILAGAALCFTGGPPSTSSPAAAPSHHCSAISRLPSLQAPT